MAENLTEVIKNIKKYEKRVNHYLDQADKYTILLSIEKAKYKELTKPGFKLSYQQKKTYKPPSEVTGININPINLINTE